MKLEEGGSTLDSMREIGVFVIVVICPLIVTPFTVTPFADAKLLALLIGAAMIAMSRPVVDRRVVAVAGIFVFVVAAATAFGVDPLWSLLGTEWRGVGLLALAASAVLIATGPGLSDELRTRVPAWLFWTGVVVAAVLIAGRFVPLLRPVWGIGYSSSTLGHRVFTGGFLAMSLVAASSVRRSPRMYAGFVVLVSGLVLTAARSALLGVGIGLLVVLWRTRRWRSAIAFVAPVVLLVTFWTLADSRRPPDLPNLSAIPRFSELGGGGGLERLPGWKAYIRAWGHDPILGSGPQTTWRGFIEFATPAEKRRASRYFADPHNLVIETADTTGVIGLLALVALGAIVLKRALRAPPDRAWALGAAVAIAVVHLVEPLNVVNTPLMFLLAGLAVGDPPAVGRMKLSRWLALTLAAGVALSSVDHVASGAEYWGKMRRSETALRLCNRLAPWRMRAPLYLAQLRAQDHEHGDTAASIEARRLLERGLRLHSWYPDARIQAAEVYMQMGYRRRAEELLDQSLAIFPLDSLTLATKARLLLSEGRRREASLLAQLALRVDPSMLIAQQVEQKARPGPTPTPTSSSR